MPEKTWEKEEIRTMLETRDVAVRKGLVSILKFQTRQETDTEETIEDNGVGFNGADAPFLTSLAKQVAAGRPLSTKQMTFGRRSMLKYAGQLARIANGKQAS